MPIFAGIRKESRTAPLAGDVGLWHNLAMQIKKRAELVLAALKKRYPKAFSQLEYQNPWELLVATILAAQCTDARVNLVTPTFFERWPGPAQLALANIGDVEAIIHSTGFYRNKAKNLVGAAKMVMNQYGGQLPNTLQELIKLPGVARKTANVVLFGGFGINAGMAVDTHVKRISHRLGLTTNTDPVRVEMDLLKLFPQEEWGDVNHRMVWFGRDICKARGPLCAQCELDSLCPHLEPPKTKQGQAARQP